MSRSLPKELKPYQFKKKYDWDQPCSEKITLRVPPSMKTALPNLDKWQEKVRRFLAREIDRQEEEKAKENN